ncbi:hypothetical protein [Microbacterium sp. ZW T5_56]|uniref:hypothetical protein n=1 Tax=Microbacterium sp. ZW T5_56 TaxID=3378081 RepID=UPI00385246BF
MFTLDTPPFGVAPEAWHSQSATSPEAGDLWLISTDGEALGLAVLASVHTTFVLCWPVTTADSPVFEDVLEVASTPLGAPLLAWPARETGIGLHMLHRNYGSMLTSRTMRIVEALIDDGGAEYPLPLAPRTVGGEEAHAMSDEMVERWERICLDTWPKLSAGISPLNADVLRARSVQVGDLAGILQIDTAPAISLIRGEIAPTDEQVAVLAAALRVEPDALLNPGTDAGALMLIEPSFKESILDLAKSRNVSEAHARNIVRSEYGLAARSDGDAHARMQATIDRLRTAR